MTTPEISADVETLLLCITNEGELYPRLMAMGADAANHTDSDWGNIARTYVARLFRERRYDGSSSSETVRMFAVQLRETYIQKAREQYVWDHNPDENKAWTPLVRWRAYRCNQCDTEQKMQTNHTGTVWNARCVGRCRTITNPHTAREVVSPYYGPHRYVRDEEA